MKGMIIVLVFALICFMSPGSHAANEIRFDFEGTNQGWIIPDWAYYQSDHKAKTVEVSDKEVSHGKNSLAVMCEFPGDEWTAALVEWKREVDLSGYDTISVDVYVPKGAPRALLKGRIILTAGEGWHFTEMKNAVYLKPGRWTTIKAKLESEAPAEGEPSDWKGRGDKALYKNIDNIKKIAVRIEYDAAPPHRMGPRYHGPIYIDNVVIK